MVIHRDGSTAPTAARPAAAEPAKTTAGNTGLNVWHIFVQAVPAIRHRQSPKPLAENAENDGNEVLQCTPWLRLANR